MRTNHRLAYWRKRRRWRTVTVLFFIALFFILFYAIFASAAEQKPKYTFNGRMYDPTQDIYYIYIREEFETGFD